MKIRRSFGAWLLTAALCISLVPAPAVRAAETDPAVQPLQEEPAAPAVVDQGRGWTLTDDGVLQISADVHRYKQSSYGYYTYQWDEVKSQIMEVVAEEGVTDLEDAFIECKNLRRASLPESVTSMKGAFRYCESLTEVNIPSGVKDLEDSFAGCGNLRQINIPEGVENLNRAFSNSGLEQVNIPGSVTNITSAFSNCESLTRATFAENSALKEIGIRAFFETALEDLTIPKGVKILEKEALPENLKSVTIPASIEIIRERNLGEGKNDFSRFYSEIQDIYYQGTWAQWQAVAYLDTLPIASKAVIHTTDGDGIMVEFDGNTKSLPFTGSLNYPEKLRLVTGKPYGTLADIGKQVMTEDLKFLGWFTEPIGGEQVTEETIVPAGRGHTVYAHWQSNRVTVNFDVPRVSSKSYRVGDTYGELPTPTQNGYTFDGWYTAKEGGTKVESTTKVTVPEGKVTTSGTEEQTLYAHWTGNLYTVTFDPQEGSASEQSRSIRFGETYGTLPTATRSGYTFDGWYTSARGGTKVTGETQMLAAANRTLYAHWLGAEVSVTFDPQGGSVSEKSAKVRFGGTYGSLPTPNRGNYSFAGWYTAPTGGSKVDSSTQVEQMTDHTLYARWEGRRFTVSLNAQGGSVYTWKIEVVNGEPYGELPTATRNSYEFDGWYTESTGGTRITANMKVELTGNQTLYAHWLGKACTVTLDPQGGSLSKSGVSVRYNEAYGVLPVPTRQDYEFMGWYTAPTNGSRITETTKVVRGEDHTLYAVWRGKACTVTLDPRGGSIFGSSSGSVHKGETYGALLSTPVRTGYDFLGWYTAPENGSVVNSTTVMDQDRDHTLYAQWKEQKRSTLEKLGYNFSNSSSAFGYPGSYRIPYSRFELIFGNTALARSYYNSNGYWHGNCFGMSSTAGMFFREGNGVNTEDFNANAKRPYELRQNDENYDWDVTVRDFIEAMQISQKGSLIQQDYRDNKNKLNELCAAVKNFQNTEEDPVVIAIFGGSSGHAIVGYEIDDYSATESRLMVYDCNYPGQAKYITLTRGTGGTYTGWHYDPLSWGSDRQGCWISYVPYAHFYQVWNGRAGARQGSSMSLLRVSSGNATVYDRNGDVAATIENGEVTTNRSDIYPMITADITADGAEEPREGAELWLPAELYTVTDNSGSGENFEATMVNVDQYASVTTTGSRVTFAVSDALEMNYVQLPEEASKYTISLNSSLEKGYAEVELTGTTGENALELAQMSGALYAQGASLGGGALKADGAAVSAEKVSGEMPDVNAMFREEEPSFEDVPQGSWYEEAVRYVVACKLFGGTGAATFSPDVSMTRGMLMTVLARYAGVDTSGGSTWYEKGMTWARENGISDGANPDGNVTREQIAAMLYRYVGSPDSSVDGLEAFPDKGEVSGWAKQAMAWAVEQGIIKGSGGRLNPGSSASRAEVATMLMRFCRMQESKW